MPGVQYHALAEELLQFYCARGHDLFERAPDRIAPADLRHCRYVIRSHLPSDRELPTDSVTGAATVTDMEAMAHLVLSGNFIGFLPVHYAAVWTASDRMRPILPGRFTHKSAFEIATSSEHRTDRMTVAFLAQVRPQPR